MTFDQKLLVFEGVFFLFLAKILLLILPFKSVMGITMNKKVSSGRNDPEILSGIKNTIRRANLVFPLKRKCLSDSIAGRWMLQRRGIMSEISFGVRLDADNNLIAHAWLTVNNVEIVESGDKYLKLFTYR